MEAGRPFAVERKPPEEDHATLRAVPDDGARPRHVLVNEPLRREPPEEALREPVLQVEVDLGVRERACVLEHDGPYRGALAPVKRLLPAAPRRAEEIQRVAPRSIGEEGGVGGDLEHACLAGHGGERRTAMEREGEIERGAKSGGVEIEGLPGGLQEVAEVVHLLLEAGLSLAGLLQLGLHDGGPLPVERRRPDVRGERVGAGPGDAAFEEAREPAFEHLRQTAKLLVDRLRLCDEGAEHAILGALREHEVTAIDVLGGLELAVDAAVALLHAARVPRDVEVEEIRAPALEIDTLPRRVRRHEHAQRVLGRVADEGALDVLAPLVVHPAVEREDPLLHALRAGEEGEELFFEVPLRVRVLGEDEDAPLVPRAAVGMQAVRFEPVDEFDHARIRLSAGGAGDLGHAVEEGALLHEGLARRGGGLRGDLDGGVVLRRDLFFRQVRALVVRPRRLDRVEGELERLGLCGARAPCPLCMPVAAPTCALCMPVAAPACALCVPVAAPACALCVPVAARLAGVVDGAAVDTERGSESLDGGEESLLEARRHEGSGGARARGGRL